MTKIKLCGLTRPEDIAAANALKPEYIGFVFAPKSRRAVSREKAAELRAQLSPEIQTVGVFVNEAPETVARLLNEDLLDIAQLHGQEDAAYIARLRSLTSKPLWQAFRVEDAASLAAAARSTAGLRRRRHGHGVQLEAAARLPAALYSGRRAGRRQCRRRRKPPAPRCGGRQFRH